MPKFFGRNAMERGALPSQQRQRLIARAGINGDDLGSRQLSLWRIERLAANGLQRIGQRLAAVEGEKDDRNAGRIANLGLAEGRRVSGLGGRPPVQLQQAQEERGRHHLAAHDHQR